MGSELSESLARHKGRGYVIAQAGFGKTHLIAEAVRESTGRQLVLTHTYAGVSAIKAKMAKLNVPNEMYRVDTIASWALRLCSSYPVRSGWSEAYPSGKQWTKLYENCGNFLRIDFLATPVERSRKLESTEF